MKRCSLNLTGHWMYSSVQLYPPRIEFSLFFFSLFFFSEIFFDPKYDRCFCTECHASRGDNLYYTRGKPAKDYGIPIGWCRFGLKLVEHVMGIYDKTFKNQSFTKYKIQRNAILFICRVFPMLFLVYSIMNTIVVGKFISKKI